MLAMEVDTSTRPMPASMPDTWERKFEDNGRSYYVDHDAQEVGRLPPEVAWSDLCTGDERLPFGFERAVDPKDQSAYFLDHTRHISTRVNPHDPDYESKVTTAVKVSPKVVRRSSGQQPMFGLAPIPNPMALQQQQLMEQEEQEEEERQAREAEAAAAAAASEREQTGGRLQSRPSLEILQPTPLKIHLQNGHYKTFSYSTKTLARDIIAQLAHKLDIRSPELYTLCLRAPGKPVLWLRHEEQVYKAITKNGTNEHECFMRLRFYPRDTEKLLERDPFTFNFMFDQAERDVVTGEMENVPKDLAVQLAAFKVQLWLYSCNKKKLDMTFLEKDVGLANFLNPSVLAVCKSKDLKAKFKAELKYNAELSPEQLKARYLDLLCSKVKSFGGEYFYLEKDDDVVQLMVSPRDGISLVQKTLNLTHLADFADMKMVRLNKPEEAQRVMEIVFVDESRAPLVFKTMEPTLADSFTSFLDGYHRLFVNLHGTLIEQPKKAPPVVSPKPAPKPAPAPKAAPKQYGALGFGIQIPGMGVQLSSLKKDNGLSAPLYKGVHLVPYQGWNYKSAFDGTVEVDLHRTMPIYAPRATKVLRKTGVNLADGNTFHNKTQAAAGGSSPASKARQLATGSAAGAEEEGELSNAPIPAPVSQPSSVAPPAASSSADQGPTLPPPPPPVAPRVAPKPAAKKETSAAAATATASPAAPLTTPSIRVFDSPSKDAAPLLLPPPPPPPVAAEEDEDESRGGPQHDEPPAYKAPLPPSDLDETMTKEEEEEDDEDEEKEAAAADVDGSRDNVDENDDDDDDDEQSGDEIDRLPPPPPVAEAASESPVPAPAEFRFVSDYPDEEQEVGTSFFANKEPTTAFLSTNPSTLNELACMDASGFGVYTGARMADDDVLAGFNEADHINSILARGGNFMSDDEEDEEDDDEEDEEKDDEEDEDEGHDHDVDEDRRQQQQQQQQQHTSQESKDDEDEDDDEEEADVTLTDAEVLLPPPPMLPPPPPVPADESVMFASIDCADQSVMQPGESAPADVSILGNLSRIDESVIQPANIPPPSFETFVAPEVPAFVPPPMFSRGSKVRLPPPPPPPVADDSSVQDLDVGTNSVFLPPVPPNSIVEDASMAEQQQQAMVPPPLPPLPPLPPPPVLDDMVLLPPPPLPPAPDASLPVPAATGRPLSMMSALPPPPLMLADAGLVEETDADADGILLPPPPPLPIEVGSQSSINQSVCPRTPPPVPSSPLPETPEPSMISGVFVSPHPFQSFIAPPPPRQPSADDPNEPPEEPLPLPPPVPPSPTPPQQQEEQLPPPQQQEEQLPPPQAVLPQPQPAAEAVPPKVVVAPAPAPPTVSPKPKRKAPVPLASSPAVSAPPVPALPPPPSAAEERPCSPIRFTMPPPPAVEPPPPTRPVMAKPSPAVGSPAVNSPKPARRKAPLPPTPNIPPATTPVTTVAPPLPSPENMSSGHGLAHVSRVVSSLEREFSDALAKVQAGTWTGVSNLEQFVVHKSDLWDESKLFVSCARELVTAAAQSRTKLDDTCDNSLLTLEHLAKEARLTLQCLGTATHSDELLLVVRSLVEVIRAFCALLLASDSACGNALSDPSMRALMERAKDMATAIASFMKVLRGMNLFVPAGENQA